MKRKNITKAAAMGCVQQCCWQAADPQEVIMLLGAQAQEQLKRPRRLLRKLVAKKQRLRPRKR